MYKNELPKAWYGQFANGEINRNRLHIDVVRPYLGHTRGRYLVVPALVRNDETAYSALKKRPTRPLVIKAEVPGKALRTAADSTGMGGGRSRPKLYRMVLVAALKLFISSLHQALKPGYFLGRYLGRL